jgi:inner membrane protein
MGIAETDSGYYMALYSNFDNKIPEDFAFIPRNEDKLSDFIENEDLNKLIRFTKGYYHVNEDNNGLYLADLRFGKMGIEDDSEFVFKFYLQNEKDNLDIKQSTESRTLDENAFSDFIDRIKGV